MNAEEQKENEFTESSEVDAPDAAKRERSTIEFPYANLEDAERVASQIFGQAGTSEVSPEQAGHAIGLSSGSSTFRVLISAAKMFGVISPERGVIKVTQLGHDISDQDRRRAARAVAFLRIPLYKALADRFSGRSLPPAAALEREMIQLGVAPKQAARSRQAFDRSARHAEFLRAGSNRFVEPIISQSNPRLGPQNTQQRSETRKSENEFSHAGGVSGAGGRGGGELDPLIAALIKKLPSTGKVWATADRIMWLRMAAMAFQMTYPGSTDTITIEAS